MGVDEGGLWNVEGVLKMTQAHGEEHRIWSQGQILALLGTDWAWIQVLLPGEYGLLRFGSPLCFRVFERHLSLAVKTNFLKPQAQEGSSYRHVPDLCLTSDLELPELPCAGATPEVTAKLLLVSGSQDFPPGKPHLWDAARAAAVSSPGTPEPVWEPGHRRPQLEGDSITDSLRDHRAVSSLRFAED
ncbi:hypothetical protein E5288_WYG012306 [Bos mutus]|uniref:Uncharacterized protein n=1 Tax=Bos mutus TaxID=72004 RepID=A0A6B0S9W5_9CETA|nr:hypothetical protein [Bos mutus]